MPRSSISTRSRIRSEASILILSRSRSRSFFSEASPNPKPKGLNKGLTQNEFIRTVTSKQNLQTLMSILVDVMKEELHIAMFRRQSISLVGIDVS